MNEKNKKITMILFTVWLMALISAAVLAQGRTQRYVLQPGDEINVQYRYTPEFDQIAKVQPDGFIALEIVGDLKLSGLSINEAKELIVDKAKVRLKDPEVTLSLKEFEKPFFVVSGEVVKPGKFELRDNMTALQAVILAGGFKNQAKASQVIVFRHLNLELSETKVLDFRNAAKKGGKFQDLALQAGDMLVIPENSLTKIERYLKAANIGMFINPLQWLY